MRIITIVPEIQEEIARRVVEQSRPGYSPDAQGCYYVVDDESVKKSCDDPQWSNCLK